MNAIERIEQKIKDRYLFLKEQGITNAKIASDLEISSRSRGRLFSSLYAGRRM